MKSHTANRLITLMWSDAARAAALEARRNNPHSMIDPSKAQSPGSRLRGEQFKASADQKTLSPEEHARIQGEANYKALSDPEKAQYHADWNAAHGATKTATASPSAENHGIAATAHETAAKSAPMPELKEAHLGKAEGHNKEKANALTQTAREKSGAAEAGPHSSNVERAAATSHGKAAEAHRVAAISSNGRGNFKSAQQHLTAMRGHLQEAAVHRARANK